MALSSAEIIEQLTVAIEGLIWVSETAAPFELIHWVTPLPTQLTEKQLLKSLGLAKDVAISGQDLDTFLHPVLTPQDWYGTEEKAVIRRYETLRDLLLQNLTDLQVYRCGEVEITFCIVGKTPEGEWIGLKTQAVET